MDDVEWARVLPAATDPASLTGATGKSSLFKALNLTFSGISGSIPDLAYPHTLIGAAIARCGRYWYLHGGRLATNGDAPATQMMPDLWRLDTRTQQWQRLQQSGQLPRPRYFHSLCAWRGSLVVFGGMAWSSKLDVLETLNDIAIFDPESTSWTIHTEKSAQIHGNSLSPLESAGPRTGESNNDYFLSISGRHQRQQQVEWPTARYAHLALVSNDRLVIIGGQGSGNANSSSNNFNRNIATGPGDRTNGPSGDSSRFNSQASLAVFDLQKSRWELNERISRSFNTYQSSATVAPAFRADCLGIAQRFLAEEQSANLQGTEAVAVSQRVTLSSASKPATTRSKTTLSITGNITPRSASVQSQSSSLRSPTSPLRSPIRDPVEKTASEQIQQLANADLLVQPILLFNNERVASRDTIRKLILIEIPKGGSCRLFDLTNQFALASDEPEDAQSPSLSSLYGYYYGKDVPIDQHKHIAESKDLPRRSNMFNVSAGRSNISDEKTTTIPGLRFPRCILFKGHILVGGYSLTKDDCSLSFWFAKLPNSRSAQFHCRQLDTLDSDGYYNASLIASGGPDKLEWRPLFQQPFHGSWLLAGYSDSDNPLKNLLQLVFFGDSSRSLREDYTHRHVSFSQILEIDCEHFGFNSYSQSYRQRQQCQQSQPHSFQHLKQQQQHQYETDLLYLVEGNEISTVDGAELSENIGSLAGNSRLMAPMPIDLRTLSGSVTGEHGNSQPTQARTLSESSRIEELGAMMFESEILHDIEIESIDGQTVACSSAILKNRWPYATALLEHTESELNLKQQTPPAVSSDDVSRDRNDSKIYSAKRARTIDDNVTLYLPLSFEVCRFIVHWIYRFQSSISCLSNSQLCELLVFLNYEESLSALRSAVISELLERLNLENAEAMLFSAAVALDPSLRIAASQFLGIDMHQQVMQRLSSQLQGRPRSQMIVHDETQANRISVAGSINTGSKGAVSFF